MTPKDADDLHALAELLRKRRAGTVAVLADEDDEGPEHHGHSRRYLSAVVYHYPDGKRLR